jgi:16S rRNA (guanine(1405)-N(7))-methyltransferase
MGELEELVAAVRRSAKYRAVCPDTVRRIGEAELAKGRKLKAAVKATKGRLHQVFAAFERSPNYGRLLGDLEAACASGDDAAVRRACRQALREHASTRERLSILDGFYLRVFAVTGVPRRVLDLACGLHPLGLPWMGLPQGASYLAFDIDGRAVDFLGRWFALAGIDGRAVHADVLCTPPCEAADVAFLLKTPPSLDRQEKGGSGRVLEALAARWAVVSFPVASLGGRERGMREHYEQAFLARAGAHSWRVERLEFATELVLVVARG